MGRLSACLVLLLVGACTNPVALGDPCEDSSDCQEGLGCFEGPTGLRRCMDLCTPSATYLCAGGEVCLPRDANPGACYLGGFTSVGDACEAATDCVLGAVCVDRGEDGTQCLRACDVSDGSRCAAGESCTMVPGMATNGFCLPS
ncbi:MAG: hypothetical protein ACFCGT_19380 [Sandaracinaceae bacterium]